MNIPLKQSALESGKLLNLIKTAGNWSLYDGETLIEGGICFSDSDLGLDHYKAIVCDDGASVKIVRFADIHRHSDCSKQDGMIQVKDMAKHTEYAGAITDHGVMYGFLEFYKEMKAAGKHPIIGFEAYQENNNGKLEGHHLLLLAKNDQGYRNMLKLCSESYDNFYRKPHVTWAMLEKYHEGIICTTACIGGLVPQLILNSQMTMAPPSGESEVVSTIQHFLQIFGEDFYLEVQRHNLKDEDYVNTELFALAERFNIPVIATTDAHYLRKEDADAHEVLLCLQTKNTLSMPHFKFEGTGYHMHSSEEMEALFADHPEVLDNTLLLAEKCAVTVPLGEVNLPNYEIPAPFKSPLEYFKHLCKEGFQERFQGTEHLTEPQYLERFDYEMSVIELMKFETYFIVVWDFINYARSINVYIGPGRGSAAGSLLAYCLGITDMDPIRFNLLFERFLNPERVSWPDVDTDIEHTGRQKVIDYMTKKYGEESVCRIVTFGTFAAKQSIKDVARVMDYPPSWANTLSKMIPSEPKMTIAKALKMNPELRGRYESDPDVSRVIDTALRLEGGKRHSSQHACGLVLSPGPLTQFLPTSIEKDEETGEKSTTSQVVMTEVEELSLLKMDMLGLKNLTAIHEVIDNIKINRGIDIKYQDIPLNDRETYKMLANGITGGVFQLESVGMTSVITQMFSDIDELPDERLDECFERLIAAVALYRPGPMDYIPDYIAGMKDPSTICYDCPEEESILSSTYGVLVYQEQLMQLAQKLAGYSLGAADLLRRACGKKKASAMEAEHETFIHGNKAAYEAGTAKTYIPGCVANGISESVAEEIWNKMNKFANYAFNRSHAACYAWIACITAYMSCHWAPEFHCAMMNAFEDIGDKVKSYLSMASRRHIEILAPDINKSDAKCTVDNNCLRIGLHSLAGLNKLSHSIMRVRKNGGEYTDFHSFYQRMCDFGSKPGTSALKSLIFAGCFDSFGINKHQTVEMIRLVEGDYKKSATDRALGQFMLFSEEEMRIQPPDVQEYPSEMLMEKEYESIGFYLTNHPIDELSLRLEGDKNYTSISELCSREEPCENVMTVGLIRGVKQLFTKKEDEMYVFTVEDRFNTLRCVLFPRRVESNKHLLRDGAVVKVIGEMTNDEDRGPQIIVNDLIAKESIFSKTEPSISVTVCNKREQQALLSFISENPGHTKVQLLANGKIYPINKRMNLSIRTLDYLKSNFQKVAI